MLFSLIRGLIFNGMRLIFDWCLLRYILLEMTPSRMHRFYFITFKLKVFSTIWLKSWSFFFLRRWPHMLRSQKVEFSAKFIYNSYYFATHCKCGSSHHILPGRDYMAFALVGLIQSGFLFLSNKSQCCFHVLLSIMRWSIKVIIVMRCISFFLPPRSKQKPRWRVIVRTLALFFSSKFSCVSYVVVCRWMHKL